MDNSNNQHPLKSNLNLARDYNVDNIPGDWQGLLNKQSDPNLKRLFQDVNRKRTLYIYEIQNLFNNKGNNSLKFSANTVKIGFIDVDSVLQTFAVEVTDFTSTLNQRNSSNVNDNTTQFDLTDTKVLMFQEISLLDQYKIYAVSINVPVTADNIDNLYIINSYTEPYQNPRLRVTKKIIITKIKDFKVNDGYPIIIKLQKPLDSTTVVTGIKIKAPRSVLFGNIKVLGEIDGMEVYPKLLVKDKIAFPLLSMPIETQPKVRILQQWFSEQILPWSLAKQFITAKSVLDIIQISSGIEPRKLIISKARVTNVFLGHSTNLSPVWPLDGEKELKDKELWEFGAVGTGDFAVVSTNDKFKDVELEIQDAPPIDSLQKLLLDMLTDSYTVRRNFDGFDPNHLDNPIAKLRAKFENQKPEEVITNLVKQWDLDYPNYVNLPQVQIFKQVIIMLSKYIISNMSINKGLNDDYKLLLPYYLVLKSKPIHTKPEEIWEFKDAEVELKSEYFDFSNPNDIKLKNNDISQNELFKLDDNQFNWLSITNELETNSIPSLIPADISLSNGEYGKYFVHTIIAKDKIEPILNLYGTGHSKLYSKLAWYQEILAVDNNTEFELEIEIPLTNLNRIEIGGIYGSGKYDIFLVTKEKEIPIIDIPLFSSFNENVSYVNIEI